MDLQEVRFPLGIFTLENFLSPKECGDLIAFTEKKGYEAAPITTAFGFAMRPDVRNNSRCMLDDVARAKALWDRFAPHAPSMPKRKAIGLNERFRFYRYDPGERFAWHIDGAFLRENGDKSYFTFMIFLNEGFEGGETKFVEHDPIAISPKTGMALVFEHRLRHEGSAVTKGRKYVMRSDVMYR
jgi:predicted 2-oxoglutarate/Fe(II)-dependent dioxygenase YbiX